MATKAKTEVKTSQENPSERNNQWFVTMINALDDWSVHATTLNNAIHKGCLSEQSCKYEIGSIANDSLIRIDKAVEVLVGEISLLRGKIIKHGLTYGHLSEFKENREFQYEQA